MMKTRLLSLGSACGVGLRPLGMLGLARRGAGAHFAAGEPPEPASSEPAPAAPEPAAAAKAPEAEGHPARRHPLHKPHRNTTPLVFGLVTVGVVLAAIAVIVVRQSTRQKFQDLEGKLTTTAADGTRVYATTLTPDDFRKIVKVEPTTEDNDSVYFYVDVRGGRAQIKIDRAAWARQQVRILEMIVVP